MISDGYNRYAELKVGKEILRLEYRPALKRERVELFQRIVAIGDEQRGRNLLSFEANRRIFSMNVDWESFQEFLKTPKIFDAVVKCVLGQAPKIDEDQDVKNLRDGVRFQLKYPALSRLSCRTCQKWLMDPLTGQVARRKGQPLLRQPEDLLLCQTHEGCPKGTPQTPQGLSPKNQQALVHYQECRAVGHFPDDAIVKRNARIITEVHQEFERARK
jgi:hypothetical protein